MNKKILGTILLVIGVLVSLIFGIVLFKALSFSKMAEEMTMEKLKNFGTTEDYGIIHVKNFTGLYLMFGTGIILTGLGIFFIVKKPKQL